MISCSGERMDLLGLSVAADEDDAADDELDAEYAGDSPSPQAQQDIKGKMEELKDKKADGDSDRRDADQKGDEFFDARMDEGEGPTSPAPLSESALSSRRSRTRDADADGSGSSDDGDGNGRSPTRNADGGLSAAGSDGDDDGRSGSGMPDDGSGDERCSAAGCDGGDNRCSSADSDDGRLGSDDHDATPTSIIGDGRCATRALLRVSRGQKRFEKGMDKVTLNDIRTARHAALGIIEVCSGLAFPIPANTADPPLLYAKRRRTTTTTRMRTTGRILTSSWQPSMMRRAR